MSAKWDAALADLQAVVNSTNTQAMVDQALDAAADQMAAVTARLRAQLGDQAPPLPA